MLSISKNAKQPAYQIMGLYEPKSCCGCIDTKSGSLILAALSLKKSILLILLAVSGVLSHCLDFALEPLVQSHALDLQEKRNIISYVCIAVLACFTFVGICSILLIHGIRKDRPGLMLPYLILHFFCIAICMLNIACVAALTGYNIIAFVFGSNMRSFYILHEHVYIHTVALTIATIITVHFQLVINAYHNKVKRALSEDYYKFNNDGKDSMGKV